LSLLEAPVQREPSSHTTLCKMSGVKSLRSSYTGFIPIRLLEMLLFSFSWFRVGSEGRRERWGMIGVPHRPLPPSLPTDGTPGFNLGLAPLGGRPHSGFRTTVHSVMPHQSVGCLYRGISLVRINPTLGPYPRPVPRALLWSWVAGLFPMSEVPLYTDI